MAHNIFKPYDIMSTQFKLTDNHKIKLEFEEYAHDYWKTDLIFSLYKMLPYMYIKNKRTWINKTKNYKPQTKKNSQNASSPDPGCLFGYLSRMILQSLAIF